MISVAGYWPIKPSYLHLNCAWEYHRHGTPSSSAVSASKDSGTNLEQFAQHVRRLFGSLVWYRNCSSYCCYCCCCCLYFCKTMAYILLLSPYSYNFIKTLRLDLDEVHSNPFNIKSNNYTYLWLPSKSEWYGLYYLMNGCFRFREEFCRRWISLLFWQQLMPNTLLELNL